MIAAYSFYQNCAISRWELVSIWQLQHLQIEKWTIMRKVLSLSLFFITDITLIFVTFRLYLTTALNLGCNKSLCRPCWYHTLIALWRDMLNWYPLSFSQNNLFIIRTIDNYCTCSCYRFYKPVIIKPLIYFQLYFLLLCKRVNVYLLMYI